MEFDVYMCFFFFKQKTAYEMRISDWSSDVCSSDLVLAPERDLLGGAALEIHGADALAQHVEIDLGHRVIPSPLTLRSPPRFLNKSRWGAPFRTVDPRSGKRGSLLRRSEEHTSELQSLMRISYAVFCLKKQTNNNETNE